ncbi:DUF5814 domain-containing protein [Methanofollis fontis]|uniref:RNA helicase n=1 Tax=Methanofollis fontis TaxID=2052832 RepID=A0A483CMY7_9EURY|nr:DUF5814 domain-containing protein [Methanofollis fontis]TAJ44257.1 RNA helicase [Methanofollis fontis]
MIADKARFRASRKVERAIGVRLPDRVFNTAFLEAVAPAMGHRSLDAHLREHLLNIHRDFLVCACKDSPNCGCPERKFAVTILEYRETGLDHRQIAEAMLEEYGIDLFPADILSFLEDSVHVLEVIREVARIEGREDLVKETDRHIRDVER